MFTAPMRANSVGMVSLPYLVPDNPSVVGTKVFTQFGIIDPGANTPGLVFTNGLETTFGGSRCQ